MRVVRELLSDCPENKFEILIPFTERSTSVRFVTVVMSSSVFSLLDQARLWNSRRHSRRPYCLRSFMTSWAWQEVSSIG